MGKIITLSGPRGAGKTTIIHRLMDCGIQPVVPYTTRDLREGEIEGREYRQVSLARFEAIRRQNPMFDVLDLGAKKYGTPLVELQEIVDNEGEVRTFNVASATALNLREQFGSSVYTTMLLPARWDDIRIQMQNAGVPEAQIKERIANEPTDLASLPAFDRVVTNPLGEMEQAVDAYMRIVHDLIGDTVSLAE